MFNRFAEHRIRNCVWLGMLSLALSASAWSDTSSASTISSVQAFTEFGNAATPPAAPNGDIVFALAANSLAASCPFGFFINATDIGARNTLAVILAAYHTGKPVTVTADTSTFWAGNSTSHACLVLGVQE